MLKAVIKEHILHSTSQKHPRPPNPQALHRLVHITNPPCDCDTCSPSTYISLHPHAHIIHTPSPLRNKYNNPCHTPLRLHSLLRYSALPLARQTIAYSSPAKQFLNRDQLQALSELNQWKHDNISLLLLSPSVSVDRSRLVSLDTLQNTWSWINTIFLAGDHARYTLRWNPCLPPHVKARASQRGIKYFIDLNPSPATKRRGEQVMLTLLSSLIHEAVHVYFLHYACPTCRTFSTNLCTNGHGRAWQLLASHIESTFLKLSGLPVDLGRFTALWRHWDHFPLPSRHDLAEWGFERAGLVRLYREDLVAAYAKEERKERFRIRQFCEGWWEGTGRGRAEGALGDEGVRTRVERMAKEEAGCGGVEGKEEE